MRVMLFEWALFRHLLGYDMIIGFWRSPHDCEHLHFTMKIILGC